MKRQIVIEVNPKHNITNLSKVNEKLEQGWLVKRVVICTNYVITRKSLIIDMPMHDTNMIRFIFRCKNGRRCVRAFRKGLFLHLLCLRDGGDRAAGPRLAGRWAADNWQAARSRRACRGSSSTCASR